MVRKTHKIMFLWRERTKPTQQQALLAGLKAALARVSSALETLPALEQLVRGESTLQQGHAVLEPTGNCSAHQRGLRAPWALPHSQGVLSPQEWSRDTFITLCPGRSCPGLCSDTLGQTATLLPSRASSAAPAAAGSQTQPAAPASNYCACHALLFLRKLLISRS